MCLAVICHPHFWQNERDLLRGSSLEMYGNVHNGPSKSLTRVHSVQGGSLPLPSILFARDGFVEVQGKWPIRCQALCHRNLTKA